MLVVADVNISQDEVEFPERRLRQWSVSYYVAQDLRRSMPDSEIVEYALENDALIVTRDKGFNYNPKKWKQDHPSVFIVRHKNRLVKEAGRQVKHAMDVFGHHAARGETVAGVLRRGKFRFMVVPKWR